jgi:hypothetical protein
MASPLTFWGMTRHGDLGAPQPGALFAATRTLASRLAEFLRFDPTRAAGVFGFFETTPAQESTGGCG